MNQIPTSPNRHRLAIIGEGPSEEDKGIPFSGPNGRIVTQTISTLGLPINQLFLGHVSTKRSYKFPQTINDHAVITATAQLQKDLAKFKPNCCLLLGDLANKVFGAENNAHTQRGTIFVSPTFRFKCVTAQDPWMVQKNYSLSIPFRYDFVKAKEQSLFPEYRHPVRQLCATPTFQYLAKRFEEILSTKPEIAFDLEGHPNQVGVTCYSIALSERDVFIVPLRNLDGSPYWSLDEETQIWQWTAAVLGDPDISKIAQNAMYELFVFAWRHKILVRGLKEDTMFKMWELFSELPKGLGFISSIHTNEPYYKDERTVEDLHVHHEYCCKDSLVTMASSNKMDKALVSNNASAKHYRFNIRLLKPYLYMQLRGCKLDLPAVATARHTAWEYIRQQQEVVNQMTSRVLNTKSPKQLQDYLYNELSLPVQTKKIGGKVTPTADFGALCLLYTKTDLPVLLEIAKLTRARTRLSDLNKLQAFSDGRIRCTYNPVGTDTGRLSSAETWVEAIVHKAKIEFKTRKKAGVAYQEMVLASKATVENLGTNLQNVTKDLRTLFIPDNDDYSFFQYDLSGADAWTVAADLAALGNDRMLVHLQNKIKPSIVIVLLTEHGNDVYQWDLTTLKAHHDFMLKQCKTVPKLVRTYVGAKGCQHGTNYGMQCRLMAALQLERAIQGWCDNMMKGIVEEPEFKVFHHYTMERLQNLYINYYGLELRNDYLRRQLCNHGYIDAASGQRRYFLDIRNRRNIEDSIIRVAASHEPQANTTFSTNSALANLFYDPENRTPRGNLRAEPTIMIHDALAGQAHNSQRQWATDKFENQWFDIPLVIHGIDINIPVEGGWGPNWKYTE